MAQKFEIDAIFRAVDQITGPVTKMARSVGRMADKMERKLGKINGAIDKIRAGAGQVGAVVAAGAAVAVAGLSRVVTTGADVEQVLINAGQRLGGIRKGTEAFTQLGDAAVDMATNTEHGAAEAAGALKFMGTASESAAVAMGTLGIFADSATANEVTLARAADIASDSIGSLGLDVDELGNRLGDTDRIGAYAKTVDLMTAAAQGANLTLEDVFETTKKSAKIFRDSGQSLETFFAATQVISSNIKGSEAGTQLKIVMNSLLKTTGDTKKAWDQLRDASGKKIKLADSLGNIRALPDILDDVNAGLARFNEIKQKRIKTQLFGSEGEAVGAQLLAQVDQLRAKTIGLNDVMGETATLASVGRNSTSGAFKSLSSTIEAIEISIFNVIKDDITEVVKEVTAWGQANKEAIGEKVQAALTFIKDNLEAIVTIGPRMLKFIATLTALAKVLTIIQGIMAVVAALTTVTAGTMGLIVLAVVAVIIIIALLIIYWDDVVEAMTAVWDFIVEMLEPAIDSLIDFWNRMVDGIKAGEGVWIAIAVVIGALLAPILALLTPLIALGLLGKTIVDNWGPIKEFFTLMFDEIVDSVESSIESMMGALNEFMNWVNRTSGTMVFDMTAENAAADALRAANLASGFDDRRPKNEFFKPGEGPGLDTTAEDGFTGEFGEDAGGPQVVSSYGEILQRTLSESRQTSTVEVTLKDPGRVVESVESKGNTDNVTVQNSGDL